MTGREESNTYICHHGVLGQKWYVRRYQPYGKGDKAGLKGKEVGEAKRTRKESKNNPAIKNVLTKKEKRQLERAHQAELERKRIENEKQRALRSGSASEIVKYKSYLTDAELNSAIQRIERDKKLKDLAASETSSGFDKIDKTMKKVGDVNGWIKTGIGVYTNINKIMEIVNKDRNKDNG